jgi:hypothetical protein
MHVQDICAAGYEFYYITHYVYSILPMVRLDANKYGMSQGECNYRTRAAPAITPPTSVASCNDEGTWNAARPPIAPLFECTAWSTAAVATVYSEPAKEVATPAPEVASVIAAPPTLVTMVRPSMSKLIRMLNEGSWVQDLLSIVWNTWPAAAVATVYSEPAKEVTMPAPEVANVIAAPPALVTMVRPSMEITHIKS